LKDGELTASDINTYHATEPGNIPLDNAHYQLLQDTAMHADHHFGNLSMRDI